MRRDVIRTCIYLDPGLKQQIHELATSEGASFTKFVEAALVFIAENLQMKKKCKGKKK